MAHRITRTLTTAFALTLLFQAFAIAQNQPASANPPATDLIHIPPVADALHTWNYAPWPAGAKGKLIVITMAQPTHRIACRVESFTVDQLACKGPFGTIRIYKPQQVAALLTPDDEDVRRWLLLGFNGASAAAAWGTLVLSATCIPCAVATAVVAAFFFVANGPVLVADGQPETVLYLAPGQTLQVQLRY